MVFLVIDHDLNVDYRTRLIDGSKIDFIVYFYIATKRNGPFRPISSQ